jgi:hypothetical protein
LRQPLLLSESDNCHYGTNFEISAQDAGSQNRLLFVSAVFLFPAANIRALPCCGAT